MLKDRFGRIINYLRVAITNKCNFDCIYCKNSIIKTQDYPLENFLRIIKIADSLGIKNFRITGGEPFIKNNIMDFLNELSKLNINIAITTNASLIKDAFIEKLKSLKIKKINISLDSINPKTFKNITQKNDLKKVLSTIKKLNKLKNEIKINTVLLNKINSDEIYEMLNFAQQNNLIIRFIEFMPIGSNKKLFFSLKNSVSKIIKYFNLKPINFSSFGPGKYFSNNSLTVGFISAISMPFCSNCNRLRITSSLKLRSCLGNNIELDLKNLSDKEIKNAFLLATNIKPIQYRFESTAKDCMRNIGG